MQQEIFQLQFALDTFYFLVCGALVMWMAAGFSMLEAGLVRAKNTTEILTKNIALYSIACLMYMATGYAIMYDGGFFLSGLFEVKPEEKLAEFAAREGGISGGAIYSGASDFFFQVVFVATAMSIVSGAVAERMKLWSFLLFTVVLTGFLYPLEGSWTWGAQEVFGLFSLQNTWLDGKTFVDFAGAGIVHMAGAAAALAGVLLLGPRKGKYLKDGRAVAIPGANMPLATLGTFILWMGWFGFNGGSVLKLGDIASANSVAIVFVNTNMAAASGAVAALLFSMIKFHKADLTMVLNGALAGLVAITAEPSTPSVALACAIGAVAGVLVVISIIALDKLRIDDPVGAISVHGVVGFFGLLMVPMSNPSAHWLLQLLGAITIFIWMFASSFAVWWLIRATIGIRISEEYEYEGADRAECGIEAYPEFVK